MRGFRGCFLFVTFFFIVAPSMAGRENPLIELSTRKDLVEMAGYGEEKLSSVLLTGTVLCEACLDGDVELRAWPVSGALVTIACKTGRKKGNSNWAQSSTDEYGDFSIDLPSHLHAIPKLDKTCIVKVLGLPERSPCRRAFVRKSIAIRLLLRGNSIRTYTTGRITFRQSSKPSYFAQGKKIFKKRYLGES